METIAGEGMPIPRTSFRSLRAFLKPIWATRPVPPFCFPRQRVNKTCQTLGEVVYDPLDYLVKGDGGGGMG